MNSEETISNLKVHLQSVRARCSELNSLISSAEQALAGRLDVRAIMDEASTIASGYLQSSIEEDVNELTSIVSSVQNNIEELEGHFENVTEQVRSGAAAIAEKLGQTVFESDDAFDQVVGALAETNELIVNLRQSFIDEACDAMDEFIATPVEQAVTQVTSQVEALAEDLTDKVQEVIISAAEETEEAIRQRLEGAATPLIGHVEQAIDSMFDDAQASLIENSDEAASKRELMEAMVDQVEPAFQALEAALDHVRSIGRSVGVSI